MRRCAGRGTGFLKGFPKRININLPLVGFLHRNKYEQKTSEQKLSSTMAEPFAGSSGTAVATYTKPSRYHLHDGVVDGSVEGFCLIPSSS